MKYIKKFDTTTLYDNATLDLPNVSLTMDDREVHYNPYIDPYNGHAYVEIGGLKWATMNVGATSETNYGLYFQWGDTQGYTASQVGSSEGQKYFGWADYKYGNGTSSPGVTGMTKYNSTDGKTVLDIEDDAARANWGGSWRMPTVEDYQELIANTDKSWVTDYNGSGINGILFTSKTDSSKELFFPAAGNCSDGSIGSVGSGVSCWSSSLETLNVIYGKYLYCRSGSTNTTAYNRCFGFPVRGVIG